ncbi:MAG: DUF3261 domain-containing protein [Pseudoalteromonas sp.]|uniref:DUF3261 domain-containing protein n=2 Tax=Pseudoalteromonas TaxID=53246 RepID=UPI003F990C11
MLFANSKKITFLLFAALVLSACQSVTKEPKTAALFNLMPVPERFDEGGWLEKFQFSGVVDQSMLVSTEFSAPMIKVAALTFEGVPLTQLQFDTQTQQLTTTNTLGIDFDGKKIIYDMQSAFWPLAQLEANMFVNTHVTEQVNGQHRTRQFFRNETLVREITYNGALTQVTEFEQNYRLKIERLEEY